MPSALRPITGYTRPTPTMRSPQRWLAFLRIVVGLWFLKSLFTKLAWGTIAGVFPGASPRWQETMPTLITRYLAENPLPWFKAFIEGTVLPNAELFAHLTALGETAVGLGLTLGLLTPVAAFFGALLVLLYGLLTQHMSPGQQGFHLVLLAAMLAFLGSAAGRTWGFDGKLRARRVKSRWARWLPT